MRHWLHDLAGELEAASRDGTLPEALSLDHVWITAQGRALLLDEAWPAAGNGSDGPAERFPGRDPAGQQRFLSLVAALADPVTVPLHARSLLRNLAAGSFEKLSFLAGNAQALLGKPARITRARRAASIFTAPLIFQVTVVFAVLYLDGMARATANKWKARYPELPPLSDVLRYRQGHDPWATPPGNSIVDVHVTRHYGLLADALRDPAGTDPDLPLSESERETLLAIFAAHAEVTPAEAERTEEVLREGLPEFLREERLQQTIGAPLSGLLFLAAVALVQVVTLTLFRNTPGQFLFGFAVVNAKGERAGRFRLFGRWLLVWVPLLFAIFRLQHRVVEPEGAWNVMDYKMLTYAAFWLVGLVIALARPSQGLHDEWTRCWLVPR